MLEKKTHKLEQSEAKRLELQTQVEDMERELAAVHREADTKAALKTEKERPKQSSSRAQLDKLAAFGIGIGAKSPSEVMVTSCACCCVPLSTLHSIPYPSFCQQQVSKIKLVG